MRFGSGLWKSLRLKCIVSVGIAVLNSTGIVVEVSASVHDEMVNSPFIDNTLTDNLPCFDMPYPVPPLFTFHPALPSPRFSYLHLFMLFSCICYYDA